MESLKEKKIHELCKAGQSKLASVPTAGAVAASAAPAEAAPAKEDA